MSAHETQMMVCDLAEFMMDAIRSAQERPQLLGDLARLRRENEALKEAFARLANDGAIRLRIAEEAPPNNMRCGQVREIRWWLMTLEKVRDEA